MLAWIFFLLALRFFILFFKERKIVQAFLTTYSVLLFLILPKVFEWKSFFGIAAILGFFLYRRFVHRGPKREWPWAWSGLYLVGTFIALSTAVFLHEDKKLAKVYLTGKTEPIWVSWKNPSQKQMQGTWLESYEVVIEDPKGNEICRRFVYGDLVGLRAEVLRLSSPFHWLGFSNLCRLQTLYNGYNTHQRHNHFPHEGISLPFPAFAMQHLWGKLYLKEWKIPGIESATLDSVYFPLSGSSSYWLVMGHSGLSLQEAL